MTLGKFKSSQRARERDVSTYPILLSGRAPLSVEAVGTLLSLSQGETIMVSICALGPWTYLRRS